MLCWWKTRKIDDGVFDHASSTCSTLRIGALTAKTSSCPTWLILICFPCLLCLLSQLILELLKATEQYDRDYAPLIEAHKKIHAIANYLNDARRHAVLCLCVCVCVRVCVCLVLNVSVVRRVYPSYWKFRIMFPPIPHALNLVQYFNRIDA